MSKPSDCLSVVAVLAISMVPAVAVGQQCMSTTAYENGAGDLVVNANTCNDVELRAHFLGSKGAFASAVVFDNPQGADTCGIDNGTQSCLKYTGDCWIGAIGGCGQDPNAYTGEISCFCHPSASMELTALQAGATEIVQTRLLVDTNPKSRTTDYERFSSWANNPSNGDFLRSYQVLPENVLMEWEDLNAPPDGDFNDHIAMLEIRECGTTSRFPFSAVMSENEMVCAEGNCPGSNPCPAGNLSGAELKFNAALGIDSENGEGFREGKGRLLQLTVNTYYDGQAKDRFAVCPVLWMVWKQPKFNLPHDDPGHYLRYTAYQDSACNFDEPNDAVPICNDVTGFYSVYPISFAREQFTHDQQYCNSPRTGSGDAITAPNGNSCGAGLVTQSYELSLADLDAAFTDSDQWQSGDSMGDLESRIFFLELLVFHDVKEPFYCPSGVNAYYDGAHPTVGNVTSYSMDPGQRNFQVYQRQ